MVQQQAGHALNVERVIEAPPEAIFDTFIALYDSERPDWVVDSDLDLRVGGRWSVGFEVPGEGPFREERIITELDRPHRLAYHMTALRPDEPEFATTVRVTISPAPGGHRLLLDQQGFPTAGARDEFAGAWPDVLDEVRRRVLARTA